MEVGTWLLYVSVISLLIFSPGPSTLLCVSDGLRFGNRKAIPTVLGGAIAALVLMTVSAIGLGSVLAASGNLFFVIKIMGALYLIYVGWTTFRDSKLQLPDSTADESNLSHYSGRSLFRKGFMVGISNPKDLLFFIALFPSFMNADLPQLNQYVVLAATWFFIDCTAMFMYAVLGSKISPWLAKTRNLNIVNRVVGGVFVGLGSALAISAGASK